MYWTTGKFSPESPCYVKETKNFIKANSDVSLDRTKQPGKLGHLKYNERFPLKGI